jgi:hypothetical protein
MKRFHIAICCSLVLLAACNSAPATQQPQFEFKAKATTQDIMESLIAHMAEDIWNAVKIEIDKTGIHEFKPQNKEEWQEVAYAARGLAEASTLLMYDGRAEDYGDWMKYVNELTERSLLAAKAADDQDPDELLTVGGNIYEVCTNCHMDYLERVEKKRTGGAPSEAPLTAPPGAEKK